jgi:hypothetical protein
VPKEHRSVNKQRIFKTILSLQGIEIFYSTTFYERGIAQMLKIGDYNQQ